MRRPVGPVAVLVALVAVLLPAGVMAAATVGGPPAGAGRQVNAAGLTQAEVAPELTSTTSTRQPEPTTTVRPAPAPSAPPTTRSGKVPIAGSGPGTATPATTVPSAAPGVPPAAPTTTVPLRSSWENRAEGVYARMRIEPASPVAGQPVTFVIEEVSAQETCCMVALGYGDSSELTHLTSGACATATSGTGLRVSHTYAAAGLYTVQLVVSTLPCQPPAGAPPLLSMHGVSVAACIVVGPVAAGSAGCPATPVSTPPPPPFPSRPNL